MVGRTVSHYRVIARLGAGGMGVVYRATDERLGRDVAIKVLPAGAAIDPERRQRFIREARAASALNHPNIVTIHEIDRAGEIDFIVMELVDGTPLDRLIASGPLAIADAVHVAAEIASALAAAHGAGIVHRDIKPGNVMVSPDGRVKVLDFGLAKLLAPDAQHSATVTATGVRTELGVLLGTAAYMSPEQARGEAVDARSDVFSLGVLLYEALTGRRPFQGSSTLDMLTAILHEAPPPVRALRGDVPAELERLVSRMLEKDPAARGVSATDLRREFLALHRRLTIGTTRPGWLRRPSVAIPLAALLIAATGLVGWMALSAMRTRRAYERRIPEATRLMEQGRIYDAYRLASATEREIPGSPEIARLKALLSMPIPMPIRTEPPGARVEMKDYAEPGAPWDLAGVSPLVGFRPPFALLRWRITMDGYEPLEVGRGMADLGRPFVLDRAGTRPEGMVRVTGGPFQLGGRPSVTLEPYWIDRFEVTNRDFKRFVDAGGYATGEHWKEPFIEKGRTLSWEDAMARFRDSTGRPGPATWELGSHPDGQADYPVSGVSWFEAMAYAAFAGKSLPTVYHWYAAGGSGIFSDMVRQSNFGGQGPAPVGRYQGLGPFGTFDMAGNVKEWTSTAAEVGRYIPGGAWNEPSYMFIDVDSQDPFTRAPTYGFRCVRYPTPLPPELLGPVLRIIPDFSRRKPVDDQVFAVFKSLYAYDRTPLEPRVDEVEESEYWRRERVSYAAAYGGERIPALVFVPKFGSPSYQAVVYFPAGHALFRATSVDLTSEMRYLDFVPRSGRVLIYPVYKGTFERRVEVKGPSDLRDLVVQRSKDFGRTLDYLAARRDIDPDRVAFYGFSLGADAGPILTAVDPRVKANVFVGGGLSFGEVPPEIDLVNFLPRVHVPTLMINGRDDYLDPVETSQKPMFQLLGAPPDHKRHAVFPSGHVAPRNDVIREALDWFDRYLGPVRTR